MANKSIVAAAKEGNLECMKYLIQNGKNVNSTNPHGWTALHMAVYYNKEECVDYLLGLNDIRIDAETHAGETALLLACRNHYTVPSSMVQKLIVAGADVNIVENDEKSALYCVCEGPSNPNNEYYMENLRKAEILINNNAHLNIPESFEGDTPLFAAIEQQNFDLVRMLLYAGADANFQRNFGECTPLIIAAQMDNYEIFKELLPFVVDVNIGTSDGRTALMLAQDDRIIKLLLDCGADPNIIATDKPITAIHLAAFRHNLKKLILLLPHTKESAIRSCQQYNLVSLIVDTIDEHHDLEIVFECLRHLMSSDIDNSIYFVPFSCGYFFPPIATLFVPCVLTASEDVWQEYLKIFYLFLSKGINVNAEGNEEHLLIAFVKIYKNWSPRLQIILDILIDQGLDADSFSRIIFCKNYLYFPTELNISFIMYLIPYFITHSHRFYERYLKYKSENDHFGAEFDEMFKFGTLKSFCRSTVRRQLKITCNTTNDFLRAVKSLEIPKSLKNYIRFKFY